MEFSRSVIFAVLGGREKNTVAEKNEQQIKHGRGKKTAAKKTFYAVQTADPLLSTSTP